MESLITKRLGYMNDKYIKFKKKKKTIEEIISMLVDLAEAQSIPMLGRPLIEDRRHSFNVCGDSLKISKTGVSRKMRH